MRPRSDFSTSSTLLSLVILACMLVVSSVCSAQAATADQETRAPASVQANLDRLVQLTQELEQEQKAILNLEKLQLYELRLQGLEMRDDTLSQRERDLSVKTAEMERAVQAADSGLSPTGVPQTEPHPAMQGRVSEQLTTTSRLLDSTRAEKAQVERDIEKLRARIAALEKLMGDDAP